MSAGIKSESVLGHRLSVDTLAELAVIDTSGLVDGDIAFVKSQVQNYNAPDSADFPIFFLLKGSTKAAESPFFIDAQGGGVWVMSTITAPSIVGTATWDPGNLVAGATTTTTIAGLTGVALGDFVTSVSFSLDLQGLVMTAYVSAASTVTILLFNPTAAPINLASGEVAVTVRKKS